MTANHIPHGGEMVGLRQSPAVSKDCPSMPGRKKQFEKTKSFRLNSPEENKIRELAKLYGVDESTVIREAIIEKYERDIALQQKPPKIDR